MAGCVRNVSPPRAKRRVPRHFKKSFELIEVHKTDEHYTEPQGAQGLTEEQKTKALAVFLRVLCGLSFSSTSV